MHEQSLHPLKRTAALVLLAPFGCGPADPPREVMQACDCPACWTTVESADTEYREVPVDELNFRDRNTRILSPEGAVCVYSEWTGHEVQDWYVHMAYLYDIEDRERWGWWLFMDPEPDDGSSALTFTIGARTGRCGDGLDYDLCDMVGGYD